MESRCYVRMKLPGSINLVRLKALLAFHTPTVETWKSGALPIHREKQVLIYTFSKPRNDSSFQYLHFHIIILI